ncbi:MAG: peptidase S15, partial [Guyparkeria sp.]
TIHIGPADLEMQRKALEWYSYRGYDYLSPKGETLWERGYRRGDWSVRTVTRTKLTATRTHFVIHAELDAWEGDKRVYSDNWDVEIPRDLV